MENQRSGAKSGWLGHGDEREQSLTPTGWPDHVFVAFRLAGTASECPEELVPKTGPGTQDLLCLAFAFLGRVPKSLGSRRKSLVDFAESLAVLLRPPPEIQAPFPCGNLHSSLINYEHIHLHVRSSAKKLDKIDPPQFILSIFPRNGLPPMFYSWRHSALSFISNPQ